MTIGATVVNNATAYGGKDSNKSWANSLEDAITDRKYLYEMVEIIFMELIIQKH